MYQIDKSQSNHNMYLSSVISIIAWCFFFSNLTSLAKFSVPCAVVPTPGGFFVKSKTSLRRGKIIVEEEEQILGKIKKHLFQPSPPGYPGWRQTYIWRSKNVQGTHLGVMIKISYSIRTENWQIQTPFPPSQHWAMSHLPLHFFFASWRYDSDKLNHQKE